MKIKDMMNGSVRAYGENPHDSLTISQDGRTLAYYNLQNGDGSRAGDYRFVMDDGLVPRLSLTEDAKNGAWYANIGGFEKDQVMFKATGTKVLNKRNGAHGVVIREWETGQILVCESTEPYVFCTHDSWDTLEVIE